jgi:mannose-6-phosphate isomerase-like protein (cupin superfamily)
MASNPQINQFVFPEPAEPAFNKIGHTGKFFGTHSSHSNHLVIETENGYEKSLREHVCEFNYYVIHGRGELIADGGIYPIKQGDMIVIPPGTVFTFNGQLKMLLINTPPFTPEQDEELPKQAAYQKSEKEDKK